jgi:hypothetical protein
MAKGAATAQAMAQASREAERNDMLISRVEARRGYAAERGDVSALIVIRAIVFYFPAGNNADS